MGNSKPLQQRHGPCVRAGISINFSSCSQQLGVRRLVQALYCHLRPDYELESRLTLSHALTVGMRSIQLQLGPKELTTDLIPRAKV